MKLFTILAVAVKLLMASGAPIYNTTSVNITQKPLIECYNCNILAANSTDIDTQFNSLCLNNTIICNNTNFCSTELLVDSHDKISKLDFGCKTHDQCTKSQKENATNTSCCDNDLCNANNLAIALLSTQQPLINKQDIYKINDTISEIENKNHTNTTVAYLQNNFNFSADFNDIGTIVGNYFTNNDGILLFTNSKKEQPTNLDQYGDPYTYEYANKIMLLYKNGNGKTNTVSTLLDNVNITAVDYKSINNTLAIIVDNNVFVYHLNTDNNLELILKIDGGTETLVDVALDFKASTLAVAYPHHINLHKINNLDAPQRINKTYRTISEITFSPTKPYLLCMSHNKRIQYGSLYVLTDDNKVLHREYFRARSTRYFGGGYTQRRKLFKPQMLLTPRRQEIIYKLTCCKKHYGKRVSSFRLVEWLSDQKRTKEGFFLDPYFDKATKDEVPDEIVIFATDKHKEVLALIKNKNDKLTLYVDKFYMQHDGTKHQLVFIPLFEEEIFSGANFLTFNGYSDKLSVLGKNNGNNQLQVYKLNLPEIPTLSPVFYPDSKYPSTTNIPSNTEKTFLITDLLSSLKIYSTASSSPKTNTTNIQNHISNSGKKQNLDNTEIMVLLIFVWVNYIIVNH